MLDRLPTADARELQGDERDMALWQHFGLGDPYHVRRMRLREELRELRKDVRTLEDLGYAITRPAPLTVSHPMALDPVANVRPMPAAVPDLELDAVDGSAWVLP